MEIGTVPRMHHKLLLTYSLKTKVKSVLSKIVAASQMIALFTDCKLARLSALCQAYWHCDKCTISVTYLFYVFKYSAKQSARC